MPSFQVEHLGIQNLWQTTRGDGVRVAVLDTGVTLSDALPAERIEAIESDGTAQSPTALSHGTRCISLIASSSEDAEGIAPECQVLSIRANSVNDRFSPLRVKRGLRFALDRSCDVISCSFTLPRVDEELRELVREAHLAGIPIIAATGNDPDAKDEFPSKVPHATVIGALDAANAPLRGRHTPWTDAFCLGDDLDVVDGDGAAVSWSGLSSGAAAIVSGIVALALAPLSVARRRRAGILVDGLIKTTARAEHSPGFPNNRLLRVDPARFFHAIQETA
jgi:hypothetical protein